MAALYGIGQAIIFLPWVFFFLGLWSPYVIGQTIIFLPCDFHLSFFFLFSSPNLSGRKLDVYTILPHMVWVCGLSAILRCRSETCCTRLTGNAGRKKAPKISIWAPSHNFVGLYLCNKGTCRQSEKNLLSSDMSSTCPHNMVNFGLLTAEIDPVV